MEFLAKKVTVGLPLFELNVYSIILFSSILLFHSLTIKLLKTFYFFVIVSLLQFYPLFFSANFEIFLRPMVLWSAILCSPVGGYYQMSAHISLDILHKPKH